MNTIPNHSAQNDTTAPNDTARTVKEKTVSFLWQHFLLLISLDLMTLGVALCVRSQLGSSVISSLPFVFSLAGPVSRMPEWTIGRVSAAIWSVWPVSFTAATGPVHDSLFAGAADFFELPLTFF